MFAYDLKTIISIPFVPSPIPLLKRILGAPLSRLDVALDPLPVIKVSEYIEVVSPLKLIEMLSLVVFKNLQTTTMSLYVDGIDENVIVPVALPVTV